MNNFFKKKNKLKRGLATTLAINMFLMAFLTGYNNPDGSGSNIYVSSSQSEESSQQDSSYNNESDQYNNFSNGGDLNNEIENDDESLLEEENQENQIENDSDEGQENENENNNDDITNEDDDIYITDEEDTSLEEEQEEEQDEEEDDEYEQELMPQPAFPWANFYWWNTDLTTEEIISFLGLYLPYIGVEELRYLLAYHNYLFTDEMLWWLLEYRVYVFEFQAIDIFSDVHGAEQFWASWTGGYPGMGQANYRLHHVHGVPAGFNAEGVIRRHGSLENPQYFFNITNWANFRLALSWAGRSFNYGWDGQQRNTGPVLGIFIANNITGGTTHLGETTQYGSHDYQIAVLGNASNRMVTVFGTGSNGNQLTLQRRLTITSANSNGGNGSNPNPHLNLRNLNLNLAGGNSSGTAAVLQVGNDIGGIQNTVGNLTLSGTTLISGARHTHTTHVFNGYLIMRDTASIANNDTAAIVTNANGNIRMYDSSELRDNGGSNVILNHGSLVMNDNSGIVNNRSPIAVNSHQSAPRVELNDTVRITGHDIAINVAGEGDLNIDLSDRALISNNNIGFRTTASGASLTINGGNIQIPANGSGVQVNAGNLNVGNVHFNGGGRNNTTAFNLSGGTLTFGYDDRETEVVGISDLFQLASNSTVNVIFAGGVLRNTTLNIAGNGADGVFNAKITGTRFDGFTGANRIIVGQGGNLTLAGNGVIDSNQIGVEVNAGGVFTMQGGAIRYNADTGVLVNGGQFFMDGGFINSNEQRGGVQVLSGSFALNGGIIHSNLNSTNGGGGIHIADNANFFMTGGQVSGNRVIGGNHGGGIFLGTGSGSAISGGSILVNFTANDAGQSLGNSTGTGNGGGIFSNRTLNIEATASIMSNRAYNGGGVFKNNTTGTHLNMNGGSISSNVARGNGGGGLYLSSGNAVGATLTSGLIDGNVALGDDSEGGGIWSARPIILGGILVRYNNAVFGAGVFTSGALYTNAPGPTIEFNRTTNSIGGQLLSNSAGGGIYIRGFWSVLLTHGNIRHNQSATGGGIYTRGALIFNNGITISGNSATGLNYNQGGGGVFVSETGSLTNHGSITGNTANRGGGVMALAGPGMVSNSHNISNNTSIVSGGGVYTRRNFNMSHGSISNNRSEMGGGIYISGGLTLNIGTGGGQLSASISNNTATASGGGIFASNGVTVNIGRANLNNNAIQLFNNTAATNGGGIFLTGDNTRLNLFRGGILNNTAVNGGGISVEAQARFLNDGGSVNNNRATNGGGINLVGGGSELTFQSGLIQGNTATNNGGGIFAHNSSTIYMTGGTIGWVSGDSESFANTATNGGGVFLQTASMNFNGGNINGNRALEDGAGIYIMGVASTSTILHMSGSSAIGGDNNYDVARNIAQRGGGIFMQHGTINLSGGTIRNNLAQNQGGGMFINDGVVNMSGGIIGGYINNGYPNFGNEANQGGGIFLAGGYFNHAGGALTGNSTISAPSASAPLNGHGGGIFQNAGNYNFRGGGQIIANNASRGGGIWLNNGTFVMDGNTTIANNSATGLPGPSGTLAQGRGGAVGIGSSTATFNLLNGSIIENSALVGSAFFIEASGGTLNMHGGTIESNNVSSTNVFGSAILLEINNDVAAGVFNMHGGMIQNHLLGNSVIGIHGRMLMDGSSVIQSNANNGAAVSIGNRGHFEMNSTNSYLRNNVSTLERGAALNVMPGGLINLRAGNIVNNQATHGAAILWHEASLVGNEIVSIYHIAPGVNFNGNVATAGGTISTPLHEANMLRVPGRLHNPFNNHDIFAYAQNFLTVNNHVNAIGGSNYYRSIRNVGETITLVPGERSGYRFDGWNIITGNVTFTGSGNNTFVMPAQDITLEALWSRAFTVTVTNHPLSIGGSTGLIGQFAVNEQVQINSGRVDGYTFYYWDFTNINKEDVNILYHSNSPSTLRFLMPEQDLNISAQWFGNIINFGLQNTWASSYPLLPSESPEGHTWAIITGQYLEYKDQIIQPNDGEQPSLSQSVYAGGQVTVYAGERSGHTFVRWDVTVANIGPNIDQSQVVDMITANGFDQNNNRNTFVIPYLQDESILTLTAVWERNIYTIVVENTFFRIDTNWNIISNDGVWQSGVYQGGERGTTQAVSWNQGSTGNTITRTGMYGTMFHFNVGTHEVHGRNYAPNNNSTYGSNYGHRFSHYDWRTGSGYTSVHTFNPYTPDRAGNSQIRLYTAGNIHLTANWIPREHVLTVQASFDTYWLADDQNSSVESNLIAQRTRAVSYNTNTIVSAGYQNINYPGIIFAGWQQNFGLANAHRHLDEIRFNMPNNNVTLSAQWLRIGISDNVAEFKNINIGNIRAGDYFEEELSINVQNTGNVPIEGGDIVLRINGTDLVPITEHENYPYFFELEGFIIDARGIQNIPVGTSANIIILPNYTSLNVGTYNVSVELYARVQTWNDNVVTETIQTLQAPFSAQITIDPLPRYIVNFSAIGGGTLTASIVSYGSYIDTNGDFVGNIVRPIITGYDVEQGELVMFTASANEHYHINLWTENNNIVSNNEDPSNLIVRRIITVDDNSTINGEIVVSATFARNIYNVLFAVNPINGGEIRANEGNWTIVGSLDLPAESNVTFDANPNNGWQVSSWELNDYEPSQNGQSTFVIPSLITNSQVRLNLERSQFSITVTNYPESTLSVVGQTVPQTALFGEPVNIYAGAREGYVFQGWNISPSISFDSSSSEANNSFIMGASEVELIANWVGIGDIIQIVPPAGLGDIDLGIAEYGYNQNIIDENHTLNFYVTNLHHSLNVPELTLEVENLTFNGNYAYETEPWFVLNPITTNALNPEEYHGITIMPQVGLGIGTYVSTVALYHGTVRVASFNAIFEVEQRRVDVTLRIVTNADRPSISEYVDINIGIYQIGEQISIGALPLNSDYFFTHLLEGDSNHNNLELWNVLDWYFTGFTIGGLPINSEDPFAQDVTFTKVAGYDIVEVNLYSIYSVTLETTINTLRQSNPSDATPVSVVRDTLLGFTPIEVNAGEVLDHVFVNFSFYREQGGTRIPLSNEEITNFVVNQVTERNVVLGYVNILPFNVIVVANWRSIVEVTYEAISTEGSNLNNLEATVSPEHLPPNSSSVEGQLYLLWGGDVQLTASAVEGYEFANWTLNGDPQNGVVQSDFSLTNITENTTVTAIFESLSTGTGPAPGPGGGGGGGGGAIVPPGPPAITEPPAGPQLPGDPDAPLTAEPPFNLMPPTQPVDDDEIGESEDNENADLLLVPPMDIVLDDTIPTPPIGEGEILVPNEDGSLTLLNAEGENLGSFVLNDDGDLVFIPNTEIPLALIEGETATGLSWWWSALIPALLLPLLLLRRKKIIVKLVTNIKKDEDPIEIIINRKEKITIPEILKEGYTLSGWYKDDKFSEDAVWDLEQEVTKNITLYAKWDKVSHEEESPLDLTAASSL